MFYTPLFLLRNLFEWNVIVCMHKELVMLKKINQSYILAAVYKFIYGDNAVLIFVHFLLQRHTQIYCYKIFC